MRELHPFFPFLERIFLGIMAKLKIINTLFSPFGRKVAIS